MVSTGYYFNTIIFRIYVGTFRLSAFKGKQRALVEPIQLLYLLSSTSARLHNLFYHPDSRSANPHRAFPRNCIRPDLAVEFFLWFLGLYYSPVCDG